MQERKARKLGLGPSDRNGLSQNGYGYVWGFTIIVENVPICWGGIVGLFSSSEYRKMPEYPHSMLLNVLTSP
eukprot:266809-Amphidinium_carterae.1